MGQQQAHQQAQQTRHQAGKLKQQRERGEAADVENTTDGVGNHYYDCGDDLSSLANCAFSHLDTCDTEDEFLDHDEEHAMMKHLGDHAHVYPIDPSSVAQAQPGEALPGRDPRAKPVNVSACPGCRHFRTRDDWEHNREIGECSYPHDRPWIPECAACQRRALRTHEEHVRTG